MKITKDFFKHVPREKQQAVLERLQSFSQLIQDANVFHEIPKGFWIRKVVGTNIYKFRVNSGDRILFTFNEDGTVTYLSFETHDTQIRSAKKVTVEQSVMDVQINFDQYENETIDEIIDYYAQYELTSKLIQMEQNEVHEDEYITLVIEDEQLAKEQVIFTREQFHCLQNQDTLTIIIGCAGSGKTNIALRKIQLLQEFHQSVDYITFSPYLMNDVKHRYEFIKSENCHVGFYSLAKFFENLLDESYTVIYEEDFYHWLQHLEYDELLPEELYAEIYTVLKGATTEKILTESQYLKLDSNLSTVTKREVYHISRQYEKWLAQNQYVDLNDLAFFVLKVNIPYNRYIIVDEIQELTKKQLAVIQQLIGNQVKALFLGDTYQALSNYLFNTSELTNPFKRSHMMYSLNQMNKNFRSGDHIIYVLNELKALQMELDPHKEALYEIAIRPAEKPKLIVQSISDDAYTRITNDIESIFIVPTIKDKISFLRKGIQRVFTMKEVQGLQYKRVYCYHLLQYVQEAKERNTPFLSMFFHSFYVAASRAVYEIVFIEEQESQLFDNPQLFEIVSLDHLVVPTINSTLEWLEEGKKLERLGKFTQAIDAYRKSDAQEDIRRCQSIIDRKLNYSHAQNYTTMIKFDFAVDTPEKIQEVLKKLQEFNLQIKGSTRFYRQLASGKIEYENLYIYDSMTHEEISERLFSLHNLTDVNRHSFVLFGVLYEQNEPISLAAKWRLSNSENYGLHCRFNKKVGLQIEPRYMPNEAKLGYLQKRIYEQSPVFSGLQKKVKVEEFIEKSVKHQNADDILNDIFN